MLLNRSYWRYVADNMIIKEEQALGLRCKACGQEQPLPSLRRGDVVQLRDGRLGIVTDEHKLSQTRLCDVTILSGANKGITTICDSKHLTVVHGYFHIDRKGR